MALEDKPSGTLNTVLIHEGSVPDSELNPWQEASPVSRATTELLDPDLSQLDEEVTQGLAAASISTPGTERPAVKQEILLGFDPLANAEEKAAQQAWASSEGHPPPPPDKEPVAPVSLPSTPNRSSTPIPAFPALAALARTFALPLSRSQRPRSLDSAAAVPSPATISSFARQQSSTTARPPQDDLNTSSNVAASGSGRSTPSGKGKDQEPPNFDFQRFLDQMKLKAAEPVAKYLRSYVSAFYELSSVTNCSPRFLSNFAKRTFTVNDQVKLINDFLNVGLATSSNPHITDHVVFSSSQYECASARSGETRLIPSSTTRWRAWRSWS